MIVVTGASGHLGQWVVARLTADGHDVVGLARRPIEQPRISGVRWARPVTPLACDLADAASVRAAGEQLLQAEAVVHLAAHIPDDTASASQEEALATLNANVRGTVLLLEALGTAPRLQKIVLASSFEVYGAPETLPIGEAHATRPLGYYGASKLAAEKYLGLSAAAGVPSAILRLSSVYGPGDSLRRAIGNFIRAAAEGRSLDVHGDGDDLRDLVYVEDAAAAVALALESPGAGALNIGGGRGHTISQLAEAVSRASGGRATVVHRDRVKPRLDFVLDIERAGRELGWHPVTPLGEGIRAQLEWLREGGAAS